MKLVAIDPGPEESALVYYVNGLPRRFEKCPNSRALFAIDNYKLRVRPNRLAIEMVASYGMPVGAETFETCVWIGRFAERWLGHGGDHLSVDYVYRREVKLHICADSRAKDSNIRQALIDRFGGKDKAIGKKASPGPLYGVSGDVWSALGVAITVAERVPEAVAA